LKILSIFPGELLQPQEEIQTDRQTDRRAHTLATHFIIQVSEVTDRVLFVHEDLMLRLASCAQYLA